MKRTGSGVLALTAALTASSIFRESVCLSRYSCTDIFLPLSELAFTISKKIDEEIWRECVGEVRRNLEDLDIESAIRIEF